MTSKHTPGPWFYVNGGANLAPHMVLHRERPGDATSQPTRVADVHCADYPGFTSSETGFANARLIAAAPDLLEAAALGLQYMLAVRESYMDQDIEKVRAAIAKARGQ